LPQEAHAPRAGLRRAVRRRRLAVAASWVRNIGIILILFAGWQLWGTSIEQAHAQQSLRSQFASKAGKATSSFRLAPATAKLPQPAEGAVTARLQIPAIGVDQYVVEGTATSDLAKGPGHYIGTALPGQQGNVAIAGHRTTYGAPFDELDKLVVNDPITLTTLSGVRLTYIVTQAPVAVPPTDVAVLNDAGDNRLTLTTCTPKYSATQRLVVVATLRTPTGSPAHHPRQSERVVSGSQGWNLRYLPGVAGLLAMLVALGVFYGPISRRLRGARWIVLAPIWLAGIFFVFVALSGLLPATL
jgi:LPXTG-site transpeptidase (sortase) family protein